MAHDCSFLSDLDVAGEVSFGDSVRESHAADFGAEERGLGVTPDAVVWPESTADVSAVLSAANDRDLLVPCFGHAGDGNLHYSVLVEEDDPEQVEAAHDLYQATVEKAIDLGGTATGEHGIGLGKREFLESEHGPETVEAMRRLKRAFDPRDILNPGKMFPETAEGERVRAESKQVE